MSKDYPKVAFLLQNLDIGGIERTVVNLLKELVKYPISLDLVVFEKTGVFLEQVPPSVRIVELSNENRLKRTFPLAQYLRTEKPTVLVSQLARFNVIAAIAKILACVPLRLILVEQIGFSPLENPIKDNSGERINLLNFLRQLFYSKFNLVAAVSQGLAKELESDLALKPGTIKVLYNPGVDETLIAKAQAPINHPWLELNQPPVVLATGRLTQQKDFATLIKSFALIRKRGVSARLIILGKGNDREKLEDLVSELDLEAEVYLPGFSNNPYAYMSRSAVFVMSSIFESFGVVLAEALACGCQVVSTDCPCGSSEILESGKYGRLTPVGDVQALANAIEQAINYPIDPDSLKSRAQDFSLEKITLEYLKLMNLSL